MKAAQLVASDTRHGKRNGCEFVRAWGFKGNAIEVIEKAIAGAPGPVVHACCGAAVLPSEDLRVDAYHPSADRSWDVRSFDTEAAKEGLVPGVVVFDPPYGKAAWDLGYRQKVCNAFMRSLAPGGLLVCHSPWQPKFNKVARRIATWIRDDANLGFPEAPVLLCVYQKTTDLRYAPRPIVGGGER